ncbi:MAG: hypothetical protein RSD19_00420, partial [Oscillospiraceae bacterium]
VEENTLGKKLTDKERELIERQLLEYKNNDRQSQSAYGSQNSQKSDMDEPLEQNRNDAAHPQSYHSYEVKGQLKRERRGKRLRVILIILIVLLLLGVGGCCTWKYYLSRDPHALDTEALEGSLPGKTQSEIEAELNRVVEEGKFNIAMSSVVSIDGEKGRVNIENVPGNRYLMRVDIVYIDPNTGKELVVYKSGIIEPGFCIGEATMDGTLPHAGDGDMTAYDAIATFHALDPETKREMGSTQLNIVLAYKNK